jgi:hypothetical protein
LAAREGEQLEVAARWLAEIVLTEIDPIFLEQIAATHGRRLAANEVENISLILGEKIGIA